MTTITPGSRYGLYTLLATWMSLTAVRQLHKPWARRLCGRFDPTGALLPVSTFFAPNPGDVDTHILCRDKLTDGTITGWAEYRLTERRKIRHMLWHPGRRSEKALFDVFSRLRQDLAVEQRIEYLQLTVSYLILLNFVTNHCPHHPDTAQTQFLLAISGGYDEVEEPRGVLTSDFHDMPG